MPERQPWQCPECRGWISPDVEVHFCDGPDGGVGAKRPVPPKRPPASMAVPVPGPAIVATGGGGGGSTTVSWTFPPGTVGTSFTTSSGRIYEVDPGGPFTVSVALDAETLFETVQREAIVRGLRSAAEAKRELKERPWGGERSA